MAEILKDEWFYEYFTPDAKFGIKIKEHIVDTASEFQKIDFYDSYEYGRFFTLDGYIMMTERDEFIYHEMIAHLPMAALGGAKRVLIIGGGDGGAVRELCRYGCVERVDMVEIDGLVVELCKKYLPQTACAMEDPRVSLHITDGVAFAAECTEKYDLILVDSTDPIGVGEGLFSSSFYADMNRILAEGGVLINQHESPYYAGDAEQMVRAHKKLKAAFPIAKVYQFHMPTYASGHWLFGFASKTVDPVADIKADWWVAQNIKTKYYNTDLHRGCFCLPSYVKDLLSE